MGWIGCIHCEKFRHDFVGRTFALFAPIQQTLWNAAKHGVDRLDLLQKLLTQLCGLNFCINYNSSARFDPSIVKQRNGPKCTQTLRNQTKHDFRVQWGGSGAFIAKNSDTTLWDELFHYLHQFGPFCTEFHAVTKWSQMHPNTMKHDNRLV